ncbi:MULTISPECIES: galactofuranosyltransferase GlfT1 [Prauserella salsuginis group]|uniref:Rhamnopyranosyl-N-acetylglucosaminyl-diphospho-decaprenol beta-1,3/1,4-galactofuranosyltransferase n=2 Tax=Prauserella salsuginis group TaxID=2893672 RepID=A0A839XRG4_9PSEU|nr:MULTISPECIES: glycosyltransferase family 2 protein [Prauserella salsuginis group]MBB3662495.1 rhamnopyranosyl-N-acetylglucosaminyl-diphospho-decaprenol beta-1,3/1,4-galactofuranosyltransferase [Prauserella sediminis]MCR3720204.1 rhamnopyranosyl-N-acetylglucosaminyl-diphospho-decaprenol beta-1,3/1,4-galactofuranosyltransferase [Prauserella flava]MCR3734087.1 rhamnopyranosyl-N-acetylglucosaminyl-diphospho-decaprenol beta-1,3/1,4-galactofuranosyltransferase [Prauserella salsuginis]
MGALPEGAIAAVVVTRNRRELLAESLKVVESQTRPVDHLIVVDNGPEEESARDVVEAYSRPVTYLPSYRNLGGAGGFALGMLHALALGAEWVWLADDDGRPADEHVLETLLTEAERRGLAEVSPMVVNIDEPEKLAFPLRRGLTWKRTSSELGEDFLPGIASLMNGALFRASTLEVTGVPDLRLFFRGDEVELHRRLARSGLPFGTSLRTAYLHPNGSDEFKPMLGGRFHAQDPENEVKRYYTYRNRGFLLSQPGMRKIGALEIARFGLYFVGVKRDPKAFVEWLRLVRQGRKEHFYRY